MLAPGSVLSAAGRLFATIGAGTTPAFFNEGMPYMANGSVAMDTNAPAGAPFVEGYALSASGALCVALAQLGTDTYVTGLRTSILGQVVIESNDAATFNSGNGITAAGNLSVN